MFIYAAQTADVTKSSAIPDGEKIDSQGLCYQYTHCSAMVDFPCAMLCLAT
jgi:hypothetical protein